MSTVKIRHQKTCVVQPTLKSCLNVRREGSTFRNVFSVDYVNLTVDKRPYESFHPLLESPPRLRKYILSLKYNYKSMGTLDSTHQLIFYNSENWFLCY